jgi:rhomboid protease GluP
LAKKWYLNRFPYIFLAAVITAGGLFYGFNNGNNLALGNLPGLQAMLDNRDYSGMEKLSEKILAAKPADKGLRTTVLRAALMSEALTGKLDEALQHAQEMISVSPADGHYFAGLVYHDMKRYEDAKRELLKAKELNVQYSGIDQLLSDIEKQTAK